MTVPLNDDQRTQVRAILDAGEISTRQRGWLGAWHGHASGLTGSERADLSAALSLPTPAGERIEELPPELRTMAGARAALAASPPAATALQTAVDAAGGDGFARLRELAATPTDDRTKPKDAA